MSVRDGYVCSVCFFFQAEDGIRDDLVTGVQTCALPIWPLEAAGVSPAPLPGGLLPTPTVQGRRVSAEVILPADLVVARLETTVQQIATAWRGPAGGAPGGLPGAPRGARRAPAAPFSPRGPGPGGAAPSAARLC